MKKTFALTSLIISALIIMLVVVSCKKKKEEEPEPKPTVVWSPNPVNGELPTSVLPEVLADTLAHYFKIYDGENPAKVVGQFVSEPHVLQFSTSPDDVIGSEFAPRYICFVRNGDRVDFYGKQWDEEMGKYYEEAYRKLNVVGTGENFTCYYITEGYPNGMYAKQSTIFSGKWNESLGGMGDFQVAVLLLETSGNPNLEPVNTIRVLGDADSLARDTTWMGKSVDFNEINISKEDAFRMFRKK